jgi:hypothetical protein
VKSPKDMSTVWVTCSCGNRQEIPFDAIYGPIPCPACGESGELPPDRIARIRDAYAKGYVGAMGELAAGKECAKVEVDVPRSGSD